MKYKMTSIGIAIAALLGADMGIFEQSRLDISFSFAGVAHAGVGQPLTPGSVAGTARRTTRRVVRRTNTYVNTLPAGCVVTTISGARYWRCGSTYYAASGSRYVVVIID